MNFDRGAVLSGTRFSSSHCKYPRENSELEESRFLLCRWFSFRGSGSGSTLSAAGCLEVVSDGDIQIGGS